jgi:RNA polymerase sigma-70 factor (ECF subfamily)
VGGLQVRLGDRLDTEERFWRLYAESLPHVYGFLLRRCGKDVAEDLTQEVYVDLARRARSGDDLDGLTTGWLISVARSRLIDHMRAEQRRTRKLRLAWSAAEPEQREGIVTPVEVDMADLGASTERALGALSTPERCALVLHHVDGMSVADVAGSMGRSTRAIESLLARARRKFRAAFDEVTG